MKNSNKTIGGKTALDMALLKVAAVDAVVRYLREQKEWLSTGMRLHYLSDSAMDSLVADPDWFQVTGASFTSTAGSWTVIVRLESEYSIQDFLATPLPQGGFGITEDFRATK